jgi:hypothetical protein
VHIFGNIVVVNIQISWLLRTILLYEKQSMQQQNIQAQPVTQEDQQTMASAEAADPE